MKVDISSFDLKDIAQLRSAALKLVGELSLIPQLSGKEKFDLLSKTLKEAIETLPESPEKEKAQKWLEEVLPHVVEAALFVLPSFEQVKAQCLPVCALFRK